MTKNSERFANKVASLMAGTQIISDMVIFTPTRHIVQGKSFERTPIKNKYYVWQLKVPLFAPIMKDLSLNYSKRISVGGDPSPVLIFGDNQELARDVAEISRSIIDQIMPRGAEIQEFLSMANEMGGIRSNMMLEVAIAYGIIGELEEAQRRLEKILALKSLSPTLPDVQATARKTLAAIELKDGSFSQLVRRWEDRNIQAHFPGLLTLKAISQ